MLSIKNVLDILIIADAYGVENLKKAAVNFILTHVQDVITGNWKVKLSNNKDLALELLEHVAHRGDHIVDDKVYTVDKRRGGCFRALGTRKIIAATTLFILWLVGVGLLISKAAESCEVVKYYYNERSGRYEHYGR